MYNKEDFVIEDGQLLKYKGTGGDIVIPNEVTTIGRNAFENCVGLTSIEIAESVIEIAAYAFYGCSKLTSIEILTGVTKIGDAAFQGCSSLINIKIPKSVTEIGEYVFLDCTGLKDVEIPESITKINYNMFMNCSSMTHIEMPANITEIGENAFYDCIGLKNVEIPKSVTKIKNRAFYGCTGLTSVKIPNGVTEIKYSTFEGCIGLTSIEIPEGVTRIEGSAFKGCSALRSITIPESVEEVGEQVFLGCSSLVELHIQVAFKNMQKSLSNLHERCKIYTDDLMILPPVLRRYAVAGFAENIQQISEKGKFNYMKYIKANVSKLVDIAIKNPKLLYLMCEEKYIKAKDSSMYLEEAQRSGDAEVIALMLNYIGTKISTKEKEKAKTKKDKDDETILNRKLERANQEGISGLVIAISGKLEIFKNREEMKHFIEEGGGTFTSSISAKVDYLIMNLAEMNSEKRLKAEKLGIEIITEDELIKKVNRVLIIPDGATRIDEWEYSYCNKYTRIILPQSLIAIGDWAFGCCRNIVSIEIPEGVKEIGEYTFCECSSLTSVVMPENVTKIGTAAFAKCYALTMQVMEGSYAEKYCIENNIPYSIRKLYKNGK